MKKSEFLSYLKSIGFSEKVSCLSPWADIELEFEEPLQLIEGEVVYGLISKDLLIEIDFGNGELIKLDELSEEAQSQILSSLEDGDWDFL